MASKENIYSSIQNLYNMDKNTWQEVLAEFYNLIYDTQSKFEQIETKFNTLLGEEVTIQLKEMYNDGSLSELINDDLLNNINEQLGTKAEQTELDDTNKRIANINEQLGTKAEQAELNNTNIRIANIVANNGNGTKDTEIIDARDGEISLFTNINNIDKKYNNSLEMYPILGKNLLNTTFCENATFETIFTSNRLVLNFNKYVKLQNNKNYGVYLYFTDNTVLSSGTGVTFRDSNNNAIISTPLNNTKSTSSNAETITNVEIYLNGTNMGNCTGKTIKSIHCQEYSTDTTYERYNLTFYSKKINGINENLEEINKLFNTSNLYNKFTSIEGQQLLGNGSINVNNNMFVSDFIPVTNKIYYPVNGSTACTIVLYNSNKEKIRGAVVNLSTGQEIDLTNDTNVSYIRYTDNLDKIEKFGLYDTKKYKLIENKTLKISSIEELDNTSLNFWYGKNGDSLGDSITANGSFQKYVKRYFNLAKFSNHGIGGSRLSGNDVSNDKPSMWNDVRINALDNDADFITVMGGTNDGNATIGDLTLSNKDTNTYAGALNVIIEKIYNKYNGNIKIYIMTPTYIVGAEDSMRLYNQANACKEIARLNGCEFIDLVGKSGMNKYNKDLCFASDDGIHPLEVAHRDFIVPVMVIVMRNSQKIDFSMCNYLD